MPISPKQFATEVTRKLQEAGHTALFAGGCVRDALLGREPKDYDVATSAHPDQVRDLFGHRRTLPIGASFGVITVVGPKSAGQIEVATFRRDGGYSDGRHPDSVEFTDAKEDAIRRDFTINGMFFDPIAGQVIDFVDGQRDLEDGIVRAIGDPHKRFDEDKLRMLRAVRFSTTFQFRLDPTTLAAIQTKAGEIQVVSPERIGIELRKILSHLNRRHGFELLGSSLLIHHLIPGESFSFHEDAKTQYKLRVAEELGETDFPVAAVALLDTQITSIGIDRLADAWRLTNEEKKAIMWLIRNRSQLAAADRLAWSLVQPTLAHPRARKLLHLLQAELSVAEEIGQIEIANQLQRAVEFCRQKLALPHHELDPAPLLTGADLKAAGLTPGKQFSTILQAVRNEQLDRDALSQEEALELAVELARQDQAD